MHKSSGNEYHVSNVDISYANSLCLKYKKREYLLTDKESFVWHVLETSKIANVIRLVLKYLSRLLQYDFTITKYHYFQHLVALHWSRILRVGYMLLAKALQARINFVWWSVVYGFKMHWKVLPSSHLLIILSNTLKVSTKWSSLRLVYTVSQQGRYAAIPLKWFLKFCEWQVIQITA